MPRVLTDMDVAWRADQRLERDLRDMARKLMLLTTRDRIDGTELQSKCELLARDFTALADQCVRCWD